MEYTFVRLYYSTGKDYNYPFPTEESAINFASLNILTTGIEKAEVVNEAGDVLLSLDAAKKKKPPVWVENEDTKGYSRQR